MVSEQDKSFSKSKSIKQQTSTWYGLWFWTFSLEVCIKSFGHPSKLLIFLKQIFIISLWPTKRRKEFCIQTDQLK